MSRFKVLFDGEYEDEVFDTEEDAEEYANYLVSCNEEGAEILNLSNPGDYPLDDYEAPDFEIVEIDD